MKKIIHVDMDYFYAQVEELDRPHLKNLPVGIGGGKRGVLCTANYVARSYGVKSAMPTFMAKELCPHIVFIRPQFRKYQAASKVVFQIIQRYSNTIQKLSLDEAYIDVTNCKLFNNDAVKIAKAIKADILRETGLTASAGVSYNKFLAKIGSDLFKPNGLAVLRPDNIEKKIQHFPIERIWGVGKVSAKRMKQMGLHTFGDIQRWSKLDLVNAFGDYGVTLYQFVRGIDNRPVQSKGVRKSLSVENTFFTNIDNKNEIELKVGETFGELQARLEKHAYRPIKNIFLKLKYHDFKTTTIESQAEMSLTNFKQLLTTRWQQRSEPVRLLGMGVKFHSVAKDGQLEFEFAAK